MDPATASDGDASGKGNKTTKTLIEQACAAQQHAVHAGPWSSLGPLKEARGARGAGAPVS